MAQRPERAKKTRSAMEKYVNARYSDWQIINCLALQRLYGSVAAVARDTGIPESTIRNWVKDQKRVLAEIEDRSNYTLDEAVKNQIQNLQFVMNEALQQVHKRIGDASAAQAATIFGILFDKQQIMMGRYEQKQTTNIFIDSSAMSDEEKLILMRRALDRKKEAEALEAAEIVEETSE